MLGTNGSLRLERDLPIATEDQREESRYEDARTGLPDEGFHYSFVNKHKAANRNITQNSYQSEDPSQSTVFTMVNKQFQPSMTTMNTDIRDQDCSQHSNEINRYAKYHTSQVEADDAHSQGSHKFRVLQQNMKEELNNSFKLSGKRNRRFITSRLSSLGPAKRNLSTGFANDSPNASRIENSQIGSSIINDDINCSRNEIENSHASDTSNTGYRYHDHNFLLGAQRQRHSTPGPDENRDPSQTPLNYENIEFGDLNPYQYLKQHNLPSSELPYISKIYFERQKEENRKIVLRKASSGTLAFKKELTQYNKRAATATRQPRRKPNYVTDNISKDEMISSPVSTHHALNYTDKDLPNKREVLRPLDINGVPTSQESKRAKYMEPEDSLAANNQYEPFFTYRKAPSPESRKPAKKVEILDPMKTTVEVIPLKAEGMIADKSHQSLNENYSVKKRVTYSIPTITVNGTAYEKVELLGKGGSGKVYKVKSSDHKVYALKRVSFDEFDESSIEGFKGEIELLKKLENQQRVVKLVDYHMGQGVLFLLMECGDHDLSQVLIQRAKTPFDMEFVRYHFKEMLCCVKVVHDSDIVHSDLKPANFVFVKGMLKIIDFGIANAVPDHTVNIYRDNQIGTPNYMAPETLVAMNFTRDDSEQAKWKVGKPSDVWSCGCILYQMVYGKPPYGTFQGNNRLYAIMNPEVKIPYPDKDSLGTVIPRTVIDTIKSCLERNPVSRLTIDELLKGPLINPVTVTKFFIHDLIKNAVHYGCEQKHVNNEKVDELAEDVWNKLAEFKL